MFLGHAINFALFQKLRFYLNYAELKRRDAIGLKSLFDFSQRLGDLLYPTILSFISSSLDSIQGRNSNRNLYIVVFITILQLFGINIILSKYAGEIGTKNPAVTAILAVLLFTFMLSCIYLARLPPNGSTYSFQVPLLPWIPLVALFFNTYLILSLNILTLYRFIVWMVIGKFLHLQCEIGKI